MSSEFTDIDALNVALRRVKERALAAVSRYRQEDVALPKPIALIEPWLLDFDLIASDALGERGFIVDSAEKLVRFNGRYLGSIAGGMFSIFTERYQFEYSNALSMVERAVGLYVFHELFHINQNFLNHELAAIVKDAFGPDELSKLDVYADIVSAHCQAIIDQSEGGDQSWRRYLELYASNITLSYNILTRAFSALSPHKKRRALGLVTSRLLVELASEADAASEIQDTVICPIYASVACETGSLVALISRDNAWEILFYTQAENPLLLLDMWEKVGSVPAEELMATMMPLCKAVVPV